MSDSRGAGRGAAPASKAGGKRKRRRQQQPSSTVDAAKAKYLRGEGLGAKGIADKKLKSRVKRTERAFEEAAAAAAQAELLHEEYDAGYLEADGPMERTYKFKQEEIKAAVDQQVRRSALDLELPDHGPYVARYDRSGRYLMFGGRRGHVAMVDALNTKLQCEFHVGESVRDVAFLHSKALVAVAQRKYAYIYDDTGMEIHCLRTHLEPTVLDFLPYHFLMVSAGRTGYVKYTDVTTGELVAEHRTKLGACEVMRHNPYNAIVCCGHSNGSVTMWAPNVSTPVVKMLTHRGPVRALAVKRDGNYMVTTGMDARMRVWDIRAFRGPLHDYFTASPAASVDISQRGLLGVGFGSHVQVWPAEAIHGAPSVDVAAFMEGGEAGAAAARASGGAGGRRSGKASSPYMRHELPGRVLTTARFRPFFDILGLAHDRGISSMIVPGSGEPNIDSYEANPYQTKAQRREGDVHALLDKIPADMITLDPSTVGRVDTAPAAVKLAERSARLAAAEAAKGPKRVKKKTRGRSRASRREAKKQANVVTAGKQKLREKKQQEKEGGHSGQAEGDADKKAKGALARFG